MANVKITDLTAYTNPDATDVLPIVDVGAAGGAGVTKKVSIENLLKNASSGTAAAPGIAFDGDSNTGIYRPGEDQVAISTNSTGRLFVDADGAVRVETNAVNNSPLFKVSTFNGFTEINSKRSTGGSYSQIKGTYAGNATDYWQIGANGFTDGSFAIWAGANAQERLRIDSQGRLLVGTSSALAIGGNHASFQVESSPSILHSGSFVRHGGTNPIAGSTIAIGRSRGTSAGAVTAVENNDTLGYILFSGANGTDYSNNAALIKCEVDAEPFSSGDTSDLPGRLVFSVTADGSASPSEALRITNDRYVRLASGSGGIQFNGDTAAANALDDYEEGTWTPSLEFGGATTGITYTARQGYYVKTGKVVHVWLYFNLSNKGSATGLATVAGLPFASEDFNVAGLSNWPGSKPSRRQNETSSDFAMSVLENTSVIKITDSAGSAVTDSTFTNGAIIECALYYRAA